MVAQLEAPAATATVLMTADEARTCVERIKTNLEDVRALVFDLKEREGWKALGYAAWQDCIRAEFAMSRQRAHQLLNAYMIDRILADDPDVNNVDTGPIPEAHARELVPVMNEPETVREIVSKVREARGDDAQAADIRAEVDEHLARPPRAKAARPVTVRRSVSSAADASDCQAFPEDDPSLGFEPVTDEIDINNEAGPGARRSLFCSLCGPGDHRSADCPDSAAPEEPHVEEGDATDAAAPAPAGVSEDAVGSEDAADRCDRAEADDANTLTSRGWSEDAVAAASTDEGRSNPDSMSPAPPAPSLSDAQWSGSTSASNTSTSAGLSARKDVPPAPPRPYQPAKIEGKSPQSIYPIPEQVLNFIDSHIGGEDFDELDRLYMAHRRRVLDRRRANGQIEATPSATLNEVDDQVKRLTEGQQMAELSRIFERLPDDKKRAVAKMASTHVARIDNPAAVAAAWGR